MADELDLASEREQIARDKAVSVIQNRPPAATANGYCLECQDPVKEGVRWCDADCRDDWQKRNPRR
jgi:hypothetical protein